MDPGSQSAGGPEVGPSRRNGARAREPVMPEFKIDANGVKLKKVRWRTKRRKTKTNMWRSKWVPVKDATGSAAKAEKKAAKA